jgi:tetratricopeptide (TPR) repeat protein
VFIIWAKKLANTASLFKLGDALYEGGEDHEAKKYYLRLLRLNPDYPWIHNRLGLVYDCLQQYDIALEHHLKQLKRNPTDYWLNFSIVDTLRKAQDSAGVEEWYHKAL